MSRALVRLTLALIPCGLLLIAQTPPLKPGRIEGNVTNSVTGAGVKKADVMLRGASNKMLGAATDAAGHFAIESVEPGTYFLQVTCQGFGFPPGSTEQKQLTVAEAQEVRDVALKIMPLGVVSGRVRDEDGEPMAHVQIRTLKYVYSNGRRQLTQTGSGITNDLGEFRLINVQPGRYFFEALAQSYMRNLMPGTISNLPNQTYPATLYPSGNDIAQAAAQEVKAGGELNGVEIHLKPVPSFHIRGHVAGEQKLERGMLIQVYREGRPSNVVQGLQQDGAFDLSDLVPGDYTVFAISNDGKNVRAARESITISDRDLNDLSLIPEPGVTLRGSATFDSATPQPPGSFQVVLQAREPAMGRPGSAPSPVKDDGSFEVDNLTPGVYTLTVMGAFGSKYLKSVQFNGQEAPGGVIDLTQRRAGEIHLTFAADGGQIRGTTSPSASLTAVPLVDGPLRSDQFHTSFSDANGNFVFQGLAPGQYQLMAWESHDLNSIQISEVRQQLESKAVKVTLGPNGNETAQPSVIPEADLIDALRKIP